MKRILLLILVIPFCLADTIETSVLPSGDNILLNPTYINASQIDGGFWYIPLKNNPYLGGGGASIVSTLYYDVIIDTDKRKYKSSEQINLSVIIINKGYSPDRDGILKIHMLNPTREYILNITETFELVPPTCQQGVYDKYKDKCKLENGSMVESLKWIKSYDLTFPINSTQGRYPILAEYKSTIQPTIIAETYVDLVSGLHNLWIFIVIILLFLFIGKYYYDRN